MRSFVLRHIVGIGLTTAAAAIVIVVTIPAQGALQPHGYASGWSLLGLILFLTMFSIKKSLPFVPLGSSASWLQTHICCGFLTFVVFLVHVRFSVPDGIFECTLALLYLSVFISGVIGLYMTRSFPGRLTMLGDKVIFEHIPIVRRELQVSIEALVLTSDSDMETPVMSDFYRSHIRPFMIVHHDVLSHLTLETSARWHRLSRAVEDRKRYLNDDECAVMDEVKEYMSHKHRLDRQYALQGALRVWLFFHIPTTYALLIFGIFHSVLVHAWSGGLP